MQQWTQAVHILATALTDIRCSAEKQEPLAPDAAFNKWHNQTQSIRSSDQRIFLIGNGASASMASHCAADLSKNGKVQALVFTDLSQITAIGNDNGFQNVYAIPLQQYSHPGDMLVAISSSGASPNILTAVRTAHEQGLFIVTLSGFSPDNPLSGMGMLNFYVPGATYGLVETSHAAILHFWMDMVSTSSEKDYVESTP